MYFPVHIMTFGINEREIFKLSTLQGIAFHHLISRLEAGFGDCINGKSFMISPLSRDEWGVSCQRIVDPRVGHQVRLKLVEVDVERPVEPERCSDGGEDLGNEPVQVRVGWPFHT